MSDKSPGRDDLAGEKAAHTIPGASQAPASTPPTTAPGESPAPLGPLHTSEGGTRDTAAPLFAAAHGKSVNITRAAHVNGTDTAGDGTSTADASSSLSSALGGALSDSTANKENDGGNGAPAGSGSGGASADFDNGPSDSGSSANGAADANTDTSASDENANGGMSDSADDRSESAGGAGQDGDSGDFGGGAGGGPGGGDGASHEGRRPRKALRRVALGAAVVLLLGGAGAGWLYNDLWGGIEKKDVTGKLGSNRPQKLNKSLNVLLIGSDTREGDNARYGASAGLSGARSDTAILLHLSPNRDQAVGISFPRDSMVKIPECKKDKGGSVPAQFGMLNAAFAYAGPTCTWKTLESLTGIHIDHFVQVDFSGFKRMVDALGGVEICVDKPVNDPRAELTLKAGKQTVKGEEALGYVRARYSLGNGSDLERIERQQKFMASVVDKATSGSVLTDPAKTYKFLKAASKSVTTDEDLDLSTMRKLADGLKGMSAGQVQFVTVPVERYAPDPNRVQWNEKRAKPLFDAIQHDSELPAEPAEPAKPKQAPPAPGKVHVTVVDAGGRDALVKRAVKQLKNRGFKVAKRIEKADAAPESRILYSAAMEAQASALARDVPDAMLTADADAPADGVRLVIGENGLRLAPPAINKISGGVKGGQNLCKD